MKALITRKLGMISILNEDGASIAVTLLSAQPNKIRQLKTTENNGYNAIQLTNDKHSREFRIEESSFEQLNIGDQMSADVFEVGDTVKVTGISKGKGFAGTIKRHRFHRGPKSHGGQSYRRPGSIGSMYPQRILPGKKMAGHMGHSQVTTKNLKIALIDKDNSVIGVRGAVPGPKKGLVLLQEGK